MKGLLWVGGYIYNSHAAGSCNQIRHGEIHFFLLGLFMMGMYHSTIFLCSCTQHCTGRLNASLITIFLIYPQLPLLGSLVNDRFWKIQRQLGKLEALSYLSLDYLVPRAFLQLLLKHRNQGHWNDLVKKSFAAFWTLPNKLLAKKFTHIIRNRIMPHIILEFC